jgi:hypothetical protein
MAGARSLAGALVPLKGPAPTNFNFGAGDYNRKTGLRSSASNKYLDSNRPRNADPQDNAHLSIFVTENITTTGFQAYAGMLVSSPSPFRGFRLFRDTSNNRMLAQANSVGNIVFSNNVDAVGFMGVSRGGASSVTGRAEGVTTSSTVASDHVGAFNIVVFTQSLDGVAGNSPISRMSFYSIGEDVTLSLLDARVTALMAAIDNAI